MIDIQINFCSNTTVFAMNKQINYRNSCIAEYREAGYFLFPCGQKKKPFYKYWNIISDNDICWIKPFVAFGVRLDATDVVLDYDPRRDDIHMGQLKSFLKLIGYESPLKTLIVKTARDGLHIYLKKAAKQVIAAAFYVPDYPAIEVKKAGQYVIGAGSTINGIQYKIIRR